MNAQRVEQAENLPERQQPPRDRAAQQIELLDPELDRPAEAPPGYLVLTPWGFRYIP